MTRVLLVLAALALAGLVGLAAVPVRAQTANCGARDDVLEGLARNYRESVRVTALMSNGQALIITANDAGGWTALSVTSDLMACIVAYGQGFGAHAPEKPGIDG